MSRNDVPLSAGRMVIANPSPVADWPRRRLLNAYRFQKKKDKHETTVTASLNYHCNCDLGRLQGDLGQELRERFCKGPDT